jgi:hypothetical protein
MSGNRRKFLRAVFERSLNQFLYPRLAVSAERKSFVSMPRWEMQRCRNVCNLIGMETKSGRSGTKCRNESWMRGLWNRVDFK